MSLNGLGGIFKPFDKFLQGIYPQSTLTYASPYHSYHPQYIHHLQYISFSSHSQYSFIPLQFLSHPIPSYPIRYNPIQFIPLHVILPVLPNHSNILIPSIPSSTPISIPITFSVFSTLPIQLIKSNQIPISHPSQQSIPNYTLIYLSNTQHPYPIPYNLKNNALYAIHSPILFLQYPINFIHLYTSKIYL